MYKCAVYELEKLLLKATAKVSEVLTANMCSTGMLKMLAFLLVNLVQRTIPT